MEPFAAPVRIVRAAQTSTRVPRLCVAVPHQTNTAHVCRAPLCLPAPGWPDTNPQHRVTQLELLNKLHRVTEQQNLNNHKLSPKLRRHGSASRILAIKNSIK